MAYSHSNGGVLLSSITISAHLLEDFYKDLLLKGPFQ